MQKTKSELDLLKMQKGSLMSGFFTKSHKINKITDLNNQLESLTNELECAECLTKIQHMYLYGAAIPFFRLDKLGVYNGALNMYASKMIDNSNVISNFYSKLIGINNVEMGGHIGNVTVLEELPNNILGDLEFTKYSDNDPNEF